MWYDTKVSKVRTASFFRVKMAGWDNEGKYDARFEVFTAVKIHVQFFWVVMWYKEMKKNNNST
jgi:hypothetical protein